VVLRTKERRPIERDAYGKEEELISKGKTIRSRGENL